MRPAFLSAFLPEPFTSPRSAPSRIKLLLAALMVPLTLAVALPARAGTDGLPVPPVTASGKSFSGDPCNFKSAFAFGYDQVLACFRSVPFCPDPNDAVSCDRDAQVAHLRAAIEGFSDLRETYDATGHWRHKLEAIAKAKFKTDFDFWLAMSDVLASFKDRHWSYLGPTCFEETLFAMIPLEFGSMVTTIRDDEQQQIIYLRAPIPFFASEYVAATGIDVTPYTGQRVVLINGEPALQFLRRWARDGLHEDFDDGINLMMNLIEEGYTLRTGSFNAFPESRSVSLVLETRAGVRTKVDLPWAFIPFSEFGFPDLRTASTQEFRALCFAPAVSAAAATHRVTPAPRAPGEPVAYDERLAQRRALLAAVAAKPTALQAPPQPLDYSEVPPEQLNQDITEILPSSDGARTVAYTTDTVAIQLRSDFLQHWDDELDAGATYACTHADRLIVDLRNNGGGFVSRAQRLAHYLNAKAPAVPIAVFGHRELATSPALNELRKLSEPLVSLGYDACTTGYEAGCFLKLPSGKPVNDPHWYANVAFERRGNSIESLTPLVTYRTIVPREDFVIPCPGKFTGKNLIVLMNGVNASAAFFAPELLEGIGTLVVEGGFVHEPMLVGRARGGPVVHTSGFGDDADFLRDATGVDAKLRLPDLPRPVEFTMEWQAFYRPDLKRLYVDHPPYADLQVPFWSISRATDGAAYRAAVSAVERHALIDPVCRLPRDARGCVNYQSCAGAALDAAVHRGTISANTAARTLEDAVRACHAGDGD